MCQLPGTSGTQDKKLNQRPSDNSRVCRFALVAEGCLSFLLMISMFFYQIKPFSTYSLIDLLFSNVGQSRVEFFDSVDQVVYLVFVIGFNLATLSNNHIKGQLDSTDACAGREKPASNTDSTGTRRSETNSMGTAVCSGEGKLGHLVRRG